MDVKKKELIAYRNAKCRERNCGPNRIFTERDIDAILAARPRTVADLAKISGFPMNGERVKKYGDDIIKIMNSAVVHDKQLRGCNCFDR